MFSQLQEAKSTVEPPEIACDDEWTELSRQQMNQEKTGHIDDNIGFKIRIPDLLILFFLFLIELLIMHSTARLPKNSNEL